MSAAAGREAINMPIQGTEADIMKFVMIKLQELIDEKYQGKAHMLLQIHDEILFEAEESVIEDFTKEAESTMVNIVKLDVPLQTHVTVGNSWDELK
jgi:DNA polymerase-1